jgi:hypothetical protein
MDRFSEDAQRRISRMLGVARDTAHTTDEVFDQRLQDSERTRLLSVTAMEAAAGTAWPPKVVALGRALAAGVLAEDDVSIDLAELSLAAMADLGRPHVTLLDLLVNFEPKWDGERYFNAVPHEPSGRPPSDAYADIGRRRWNREEIEDCRHQLRPVLSGLIGTLQRFGLVDDEDLGRHYTERLGKELVNQINEQAEAGKQSRPQALRPHTVLPLTPSWAPTRLGERILDFYKNAAEEGDLAIAVAEARQIQPPESG